MKHDWQEPLAEEEDCSAKLVVAVSPKVGAETARRMVAMTVLTGIDTSEEGEGRTPRGTTAPGGIWE